MAQLKSTIVQGSLRVTDTTYTTDLNLSSATASQFVKTDANKSLITGTIATTDIPTLSITDKTSGTLTVGRGGTGATSFTSGALLIGNGTNAVSTRTIKNMTALGDLGWTAAATDIYIPTVNTLAYWNGRYNSSSSNLTYCNKGAFGNAVTYGVDDATANGALGTGTGLTTERSVYYGLVTVNNASQTRATGIYAPTNAGTANQILVSAGGTSAPTWKATANGAAYATSANGALTFGTLPTAQGGTGNTTGTATYATTAQETAAELYPVGVTSSAPTALKRDTSIIMSGGVINAVSLGLLGPLDVTGTTTLSGPLKINSILEGSSTNYGAALPDTGNAEGRIFFQTSALQYELPTGGAEGTFLIKDSAADRDVIWGNTVSSLTTTGNIQCNGNTNVTGVIHASQVYNAVWNDYAECRNSSENQAGRVVTETYSGQMERANQRLMPGCKVISDTYGTLMGESDTAKTPIALAGRVLVYPYKSREQYQLGDAVCSAPNGTVDIMSREEITQYPERIVGTVSEIPTYEQWRAGSKENPQYIDVDGRIWIYVR